MIRASGVSLLLIILSIAFGMLFGNGAMYAFYFYMNGSSPPVRHMPIDIIVAAYASMIGAGMVGFVIGRGIRP